MTITRVDPEDSGRLIAEACAQAEAIGVPMCFAVVDVAGNLTDLHRMPNAGWTSVGLAHGKARTAVAFSAATSALAERWSGAPLFASALIAQDSGPFVPAPGGVPIVLEDEVVGAIGASGGTGAQDESVVTAAAVHVACQPAG